jgi:eukaryotic-like serine/threonine-protein kinase
VEPSNESNTKTGTSSEFLQAVRSSAVLSEKQFEKVEANVAEGNYPPEPAELASRLVKDGVLTAFQARQILKGKSQGLVFGRYVIVDFLGKGGMGSVYKAWHRMMGRVVALKILDPRCVANNQQIARFRREMQLVGRLDHPNVVRAFDADRVAEYHFIAMEYVAGQNLEDLLKERGALPPADVVYFASQAADGLAHAHALSILHRDVKPSNLLLTEARKVKILDFGLGTLLAKDELPGALTAAGITVGTPDYLSPEQARMVKLDGRSDLYSLGCTMYHLITGQLPFKGESSMDCIVGRITGKAIPISQIRPGLPPRLVEVIEKLMATNPDDRYQTAKEAADAMRSLLRPKNLPADRAAPTVAAVAPVGEPVPKTTAAVTPVPQPVAEEDTNLETPSLPPRAGARLSKPKRVAPRSRWTDRVTKDKRILATVAGAAILLIVVPMVLFMSSKDERPAPRQETSHADSDAVPPKDEPPASPRQTSGANSRPVPPKGERPAAPQQTLGANSRPVPPATAGGAEVRGASLVIENPTQGATVGMREELTGRMEGAGWPVIFVQAIIPGQPWWCQAAVENVDGGRFTVEVVFGDERTPSGTKYRIAGVVARTREEALKFQIGNKVQALPEGLQRSAEVVVTHQ